MEYITILDQQMRPIGTKSRAQVHQQGLWHKTFHCWFFREEHEQRYLLFQRRSPQKDTFANLLDVTAAGHLQANETVADGVREIQEELGVEVPFHHLQSLGIIPEEFLLPGIINREFHHVYLYQYQQPIEYMRMQEAEVSGMSQVEIDEFDRLIRGETQTIEGLLYATQEERPHYEGKRLLHYNNFCPHSVAYYQTILTAVRAWSV